MPAESSYTNVPGPRTSFVREQGIEDAFIAKLHDLKYTDRPEIRDRAALEANFREKAELALMADLYPLLTKRAVGRDISGFSAYEQ